MPLKWIAPQGPAPASAQSPLVPEEPKIVLVAPGSLTPASLTPRNRLKHALAAGSLLAVALRPMPRPQMPPALASTIDATKTHPPRTGRNRPAAKHANASAAGDRITLGPSATFSVTTLNASGPGSLFQAVQDANANPGADTITFQPGLTGIIALTATLNVTDSVSIIGPGPGVLSVSGGNTRRVFYLYSSSNSPLTATITGLTIRDGSSGGGAGIRASTFNLTLDQVDLISNTAASNGNGGGLNFDPTSSFTVSLTIRNSLLSGNHAGGTGGGIYLYHAKSGVVITNTQIVSNTAVRSGGGVYLYNANSLLIEDSTIMSNKAMTTTANGGGLDVKYSGTGMQIIRRTTISGNAASGSGGGIEFYSPGDVLIEDSTIAGNTANKGGGIDVEDLNGTSNTIRRTTISGNSAVTGGGVYLYSLDTPLLIENSTLSGNHATGHGGGVYLYNPKGASIQNSTIFSNTAAVGGGIQVGKSFVPITDTIIAGNVAPLGPDITGTFQLRYDLVQITGTAAITDAGGNIFGLDPLLGPLANNGGPTHTHLPARNSPAVNHGDPTFAPPPATDQRGQPRVMDGRIDIGSVEIPVELFLPLIRR